MLNLALAPTISFIMDSSLFGR